METPTMDSAAQPAPPSKSSDVEARKVFRNELSACLTLVASVGMSEEQRRDWFAVAWDTLKHIPPDILALGARQARMKCDHPAKIVPTIVAETAQSMRWVREQRQRESEAKAITGPDPHPPIPHEETQRIIREAMSHLQAPD